MTIRERLETSETDGRLLLLLLILLLVVAGSGLGTFLFDPQTPEAGNITTLTPTGTTTPSPTAAGGSSNVTPTPDNGITLTATPSDDTPADTPTEDKDRDDDDERDDDNDRLTTPSPGLELGDDQPLFSAEGIVPGQSGRSNLSLRNVAGEDAQLTISSLNVTDEENGITGAESSVDNTSNEGELSKYLEVRFAIVDGAGAKEYVVGTDSEYVLLDNVSSEIPSSEYPLGSGEGAAIVTEWYLPPETGNEVQSDGVSVDVGLTLESTPS